MAKLIIYRGDALDREIDLSEQTFKIGRGDQNDIVLTDPGKSVSRFHAELRFEQGRFSIVDLNSQNGTWVAGRRVQQAVLEPGIPAVLGTYRIVLKREAPPAPPEEPADATLVIARPGVQDAATPAPPEATLRDVTPSTAATMVGAAIPPDLRSPTAPVPPVPRPVSPAQPEPPKPASAPPPVAAAPVPAPKPEPSSPPAPTPETPVAPPSAPPPAPAPPPAAVKAAPPKPAPAPPKPAPAPVAASKPIAASAPAAPPPVKPAAKKGLSKGILIAAFAALVVVVMAAAVFLTPLREQLPGFGGAPSQAPATPPEAVPAAAPTETPAEVQRPADNPAAVRAAPGGPAPAAASTPTAPPERPAQVPEPAAKPPAPPDQPSKPPATATPARATPRVATPAGNRAAAPPPPAARRGGEKSAPAAKPLNIAQTIDEGRSAMIKGDYVTAIGAFEAALKADPKNTAAADLLGVAKGGAKNASQLAVDSGNKAEMGGDYDAAAKQYERALQLDPESTAAPDAIRRMKARMQGEGEDAFKRARQYDALGRAKDAIPMYEKALRLLPPDHASLAVVKERLAALKGGF